jgi:integrase
MPVTTLPAKGRLTPASIAKLITTARAVPGFIRHAIGDTDQPGLFLVVGRRTASWALKFRPRGLNPDGSRPPPSAYVIGDAALISVDGARAEAAALRAKIAMGAHPTHEKAAKRALTAHDRDAAQSEAHRRAGMIAAILDPGAIKNAMALDFSVLADATLSQCVVAFDLHGSKGGLKTRADTKAHLMRALEEMVVAAEMKAAELKQSRITGLARLHADRPATGRHRVGSLNRLFKWLASVEAVSANPVVNIALPSPPAPRTRVITAGQVKALWEGAATLPEPRRDYLHLLLLLPLRRQELADTRRKDIHVNGDRLELVIASHRSKNRIEHRLPLVAEAREIVERLLAAPGAPDDFLLKLSEDGSPMNSWRRFQEAIERASRVSFGFHDPRRLFATESGEHDLADFTLIDAALNHAAAVSKTGAARAYHHARHTNARANLMTAWAALINHAVLNGRWPREEPQAGNVLAFNFASGK